VACLEAGKHVFVEKPMALCSADAGKVVRAARLADRRAMVGLILHYHPAVEQLRQWLWGGILGRVRGISSSRHGSLGSVEEPWWSLGPHDVSMACFLLRRDPQAISLSRRVDDAVTTVDACLEFEGGCTAEVSVATGNVEKVRRLVVVGTRAVAVFDDTRLHGKLLLFDVPGRPATHLAIATTDLAGLRVKATPRLPLVEPLRAEAAHFADALLSGTPFLSDVVDGARVVGILEAGQESLALGGRPVSFRTAGDGRFERFEDRVSVAGRVQVANRVAAL
jgi:predicted dehydrogenase